MDSRVLDKRLRSVLSQRLGLPLLYALHGEDPATLKYLGRKRALLTPNNERRLNGILAKAIVEWKTGRIQKEPHLTRILAATIMEQLNAFNALNELKVREVEKPDGNVRVIFREAKSKRDVTEPTPLTVIEFGLNGYHWWKKLDQCVKYVERIRAKSQHRLTCARFDKPLLLAVITYDAASNEGPNNGKFRFGVFLCCPSKAIDNKNDIEDEKDIEDENDLEDDTVIDDEILIDDENDDIYQMSLLWHAESNTLEDASNMFGRLLRVTADFRSWRDNNSDEQSKDDGYEYFSSSNCCKIRSNHDNNYMVLRCYDHRFGKIERSPFVYLSEECKDIVGKVENHPVVKLVLLDGKNTDTNGFWNKSNGKLEVPFRQFDTSIISNSSSSRTTSTTNDPDHSMLLLMMMIIAVPYRPGSHIARKPKDFVPIIKQLQELHNMGFVHGDIRAFNTVFGEKENEGSWLIDFDFGGKIGDSSTKYSTGYRARLDDGYRKGEGGNPILTWHDWFALGQLIFYVHSIDEPEEATDEIADALLVAKRSRLSKQWKKLDNDPTPEMIKQLKEFLCDLDKKGWTVRPTGLFEGLIEVFVTGSPPPK
eukprot:scaffold1506_cov74-Cylindrotheca_fusiformis.AAC.2